MPIASSGPACAALSKARVLSRKSFGAALSQLMDFSIANPLKARCGSGDDLLLNERHEIPDAFERLDFRVGELDFELSLHGDDQADVAQAVPFVDVVGGRVLGHGCPVEIDIEDVRHDVPDFVEN